METKNYSGKYLADYDADFYRWTNSQVLGDAQDLWISDLDAVIRDRKDNLLLLEIKRLDFKPKPYQARNMAIIDALINAGIQALAGIVEIEIDGKREKHRVNYHGYKLLQLSGTSFFKSEFKIDGDQVTAQELAQILSFALAIKRRQDPRTRPKVTKATP